VDLVRTQISNNYKACYLNSRPYPTLNTVKMKYLFIIPIVLLVACRQKQPELNIPKIKLNLLDTPKVFIEDIAKNISYVELTEKADTMLRFPTNVFLTDSLVIIADKAKKTIFLFDKKGNLKNKIKHLGDKFKRFSDITDVIYDESRKQIEVLDFGAKEIFEYDLNGKLVNVLNVLNYPNLGRNFVKAQNMYVTPLAPRRTNIPMNRLSIFEKNKDLLSLHTLELTSLPVIQGLDIAFPHVLDSYKDSIYYLPLLDDKIYNIGLNEAVPAYQIDASRENTVNEKLKSEKRTRDHFEYWKKMEAYNVIYNVKSLFITDKWITFRYNYQSKATPRNVFYSKKTGKVLQATEYLSKKDPNFRLRSAILAKYKDSFVMMAPIIKPINPATVANPFEKGNPKNYKFSYRLIVFQLKDF
jgi:hypothetical protein